MTVIFSKTCELGLQAVLFLSAQGKGELFNALQVATELKVPKEYVSKVLQILTESGIVGSKKGKKGGFFLSKGPESIRLIDIVIAIDGEEVFNKCVLGFRGCSHEKPCPVHHKWGKLREETIRMLSNETLAQLKMKTLKKLSSL